MKPGPKTSFAAVADIVCKFRVASRTSRRSRGEGGGRCRIGCAAPAARRMLPIRATARPAEGISARAAPSAGTRARGRIVSARNVVRIWGQRFSTRPPGSPRPHPPPGPRLTTIPTPPHPQPGIDRPRHLPLPCRFLTRSTRPRRRHRPPVSVFDLPGRAARTRNRRRVDPPRAGTCRRARNPGRKSVGARRLQQSGRRLLDPVAPPQSPRRRAAPISPRPCSKRASSSGRTPF